MMIKNSNALLIPLSIALISCGTPTTRVHEKQRTPSSIKISHFNIHDNTTNLRFDYRSNRKKILKNINCYISINEGLTVQISEHLTMQLGIFSTEILKFDTVTTKNSMQVNNPLTLNYVLECKLKYDKGVEFINTNSTLHRIPGSQTEYR